ncbi:DUF1540 domain-containing protein [Desulforamulus aquiferis]|uniref:DUF1540 domain-containing protein n=1 Tax=Desulforamulus aquiferis TaxID=1397668 RepID=A0AAW7ZEL7_9FIRM|nr:DUF1540 domain-containing protein [Desulforamulus aquiferis]MDO7787719.1 DUF1540 domain-containing protein [Desulforamulus aquiferis]RYD03709.1 hypothetical protein N752_18345 [Desulforamulus aquiferis]
MNQHIHCIVSDCHYYAQGNKCVANEILVATDQFGASQPENVDAAMAKQYNPQQAGNCMETCCKSYIPKGSKNIKADGITKMS